MPKYHLCPKCKNKLLIAMTTVDEFYVDEEPYCAGVKEEGKIIQDFFTTREGIEIGILYCEMCDKVIEKWWG